MLGVLASKVSGASAGALRGQSPANFMHLTRPLKGPLCRGDAGIPVMHASGWWGPSGDARGRRRMRTWGARVQ